MSAPATSRDRTSNVVRLTGRRSVACASCGERADWQVGPDDRACTTHLGEVLTHAYATVYDGFVPVAVAPLRSPGGVA